MKKWLFLALVILVFLSLCACGSTSQSSQGRDVEQSPNLVVDEETILGFYDILAEVGINESDIGEVTKIDDWRLGPRYSFSTHGTTVRVNCTPDGTIQSLTIGLDVDLYKLGYEPWTIDNFIVDENWKEPLISKTEDVVSSYLNYPATADFALLDWSFGRRFNQYTVRSQVEAKNGFGVSEDIDFTAGYQVEDDSAELIYLEIAGTVVKNESDKYPLPERKEVDIPVQPSENGTIHIVDGQLGDYGKKVQLDSYEYEWYMVPAGKYEAVSNVKTCTVYVDKDEITRNSSGYVEMQNVATYTWSYGETIEIEVGEGEHLFNVYGADYVLTPIS